MMFRFLLLSAASVAAVPAFAQATTPQDEDVPERDAQPEIVVTAERIAGSVDSDFPPDLVLDQAAIASYGASSVTDLLASLSVQTQSTRSRGGGGFPVVLLNGRRISGFAEVRDLPPEAIKRVEVLTEDVAIRYGFSPGQRVVNFILQDNFSAMSGEVEHGGPSSGGRDESEATATYLRIAKKGRINLSAQYNLQTALSENERPLVPAGLDSSGLRDLLPKVGTLQLNGTISRALSETITSTINLRYDDIQTDASQGRPLALIANPSATPFALLERSTDNRAFRSGLTLDGNLGRWRWTVTGNYDRINVRTLTDRNFTNPALLSAIPQDSARSRLTTGAVIANINGPIFRMPAGPAILAARVGYDDLAFRSSSTTATGTFTGRVNRSDVNGRMSLEIPILRRSEGLGRALGEFTINGNFAIADLSDFGSLESHGYGFVWSPLEGLSFVASLTSAQAAPTPQQLGDPTISTPNVAIFDYQTGNTVAATLISGGNPLLRAEEQRDKSFTLSYTPPSIKSLTLSGTFTQKRSDDLLTSFPALTFDIERAFPGRVVRDANGTLLSIDQRPINFLGSRDDIVRYGIQFSREFGQPARSPAAAAGIPGPGGPRRQGSGSGPGAGRGGGGGGFGMFGGGGAGGRWSISAFHSVRLNDEIAIAQGLPILDRLNGGATSFNGGTPRHVVDVEGGFFHRGMGFRFIGNWRSGTRIDGGTNATDLIFSELMTINLRMFVNFDQRKNIVKAVPFLKGSRIAFRVNNLTNAIQNVRDGNSQIPLRYQPGYIDPLGRTWEISFRKLF
jgi:iron complex outermembrane recepter protein